MIKVYIWSERHQNYDERMARISETVSSWIRFPHLCELKLLPKE